MESNSQYCQATDRDLFSRRTLPPLVYSVFWRLRNEGLIRTLGRVFRRLGGLTAAETRVTRTQPRVVIEDRLLLKPGEWVEVRSEEEILPTLNSSGRNRGMEFLPQMRRYYGQRYRVYKRVESVFFEEVHQRRRMKDTVLLEGSICDGYGAGCDRSCFFFWREAWLKRVPGPGCGGANDVKDSAAQREDR